MAGLGLEGAGGAIGTFRGLQDWMQGRRQKVVQGQRDEDRLREQALQNQALAAEAADREYDMARQRVLDEQNATLFQNKQTEFQQGQTAFQQEQAAQLTPEQMADVFKQIDASDQLGGLPKLGLKLSIQKTRSVPREAWDLFMPKAQKVREIDTVDAQGRPVTKVLNEADTVGQTYAKYVAPVQGSSGAPSGSQWVAPAGGGPSVYRVPQPGDQPVNTRSEGRPMLSGDANRITDIDVGLSELGELRKVLTPGTTGGLPWVASMVPKPLTGVVDMADKAMTGGVLNVKGAQNRMALIATVKQIIGKSLEGGVLRKEDETKYAHILPTIDDPDENITSKLANLDRLMTTRRGQLLENLTSAGVNTSKFSTTPTPPAGGGGTQRGRFNPATGKVEW